MEALIGFFDMSIRALMIEWGLTKVIPAYGKISKKRVFGIFLILWAVHGQFIQTIESSLKHLKPNSSLEFKKSHSEHTKK